MSTEADSVGPERPETTDGNALDGRAVQNDPGGGATAQASASKREYPAHSDGVVCRCAVHWRRETLARGLNRLFAESDEPAER